MIRLGVHASAEQDLWSALDLTTRMAGAAGDALAAGLSDALTLIAADAGTSPQDGFGSINGRPAGSASAGASDGPGDASGAGLTARLTQTTSDGHYFFSGDRDVDAALIGSKWTGSTVTYSFPTSGALYGDAGDYYDPDFINTHTVFNAAQKGAARYAFNLIETYVLLDLDEMTETASAHANIRLSQNNDDGDNPSAQGNFPGSDPWDGDIWFGQNEQPFYTTPAPGNWGQATMMHEIGHTLGLKHGHQDYTDFNLVLDGYIDGPGPRYGSQSITGSKDGQAWSLMTYRSDPEASIFDFSGEGYNQPQTYMQLDIAALQYMYGADFTYRTGNTDYTFSATTGQMFVDGNGQASPTGNVILRTIWDGGGVDTYNFSNYTGNQTINLAPGAFSTFSAGQLADHRAYSPGTAYAPGNIANALLFDGDTRSLIENAVGGSGADRITGNTAGNTLTGNTGADTLAGASGDDELNGGSGKDLLQGGLDADTLNGGGDNDAIFAMTLADPDGSGVADVMNGESGNDSIIGAGGADTADGGSGADLINGWAGNDLLQGGLNGDTVQGGVGDDRIYAMTLADADGSTTADSLAGGTGNDTLTGSGGGDTLSGDANNDVLHGGGGADLMQGGLNLDTLNGGAGNDRLFSNTELNPTSSSSADVLNGDTGNDTITGSGGGDTVSGGGNNDSLLGLDGNDLLQGSFDADTLRGGNGNDRLFAMIIGDPTGSTVADIMYGDAGADTIVGSGGADTILGGADLDRLLGGAGGDVFVDTDFVNGDSYDGGTGSDTIDYSGITFGPNVVIDLAAGATSISGGNSEALTSFENVEGSQGAESIVGSSVGNVLNGNGGSDTINGGSLADTIDGGAADDRVIDSDGVNFDVLAGGLGVDTLDYSGVSFTNATINLAAALTSVGGGGNTETIAGFENVDASQGGDLVVGSSSVNVLNGNGGNDTIRGGGSLDVMDGGTGIDTLDYTDFPSLSATIDLAAGTWQAGLSTETAVNFENVLATAGQEHILGTSGANRIEGRGGSDTLDGRFGADQLIGGDGLDLVYAGFGADSMSGGAGVDTLDYSVLAGEAFVDLAFAGPQNTHSGGNDSIIGFENVITGGGDDRVLGSGDANRIDTADGADTVKAAGGDDTVLGGAGADKLKGGGGADYILGGAGSDILRGGFNTDLFDYDELGHCGVGLANSDLIQDFSTAEGDRIDLADLTAAAITYIAGSAFGGVGAAEVRVEAIAQGQLVQLDADGDGDADLDILALNGGLSGGAADFVL